MKDKGESFKLYLGFAVDPPDKFTNEVVFGALSEAGISTDNVVIEYKGKEIRVLEVNPAFVKNLYRSEPQFGAPIRIEVYARIRYAIQKYRLLEKEVTKHAKYGRYKKK